MEMFLSNNNISNSTNSISEETLISSVTRVRDFTTLNPMLSDFNSQNPNKIKKKRNLPGNPDPEAEVIALSPKTLMATNRFVCEICNKGFQRDQNLQLHRRGHNLPWKLKQRNSKDIIRKRVYVCPEIACVHHHPSRALGDLTGIKKHFCRKHGEKKWKCEKCSKIYAVQSDWKAHSKTCGTREYRCDCGTLFSRKDSFVTHRAFCDALAEESARLSSNPNFTFTNPQTPQISNPLHSWDPHLNPNNHQIKPEFFHLSHAATSSAHLSATALLQKASSVGLQPVGHVPCTMSRLDYIDSHGYANWQKSDHRLTRDFLGLNGHHDVNNSGSNVDVSVNVRNLLTYTGGADQFSGYERDNSQQNSVYGFSEAWRNNC